MTPSPWHGRTGRILTRHAAGRCDQRRVELVGREPVDQQHRVSELSTPLRTSGLVHFALEEEVKAEQPVQVVGGSCDGIARAHEAREEVITGRSVLWRLVAAIRVCAAPCWCLARQDGYDLGVCAAQAVYVGQRLADECGVLPYLLRAFEVVHVGHLHGLPHQRGCDDVVTAAEVEEPQFNGLAQP